MRIPDPLKLIVSFIITQGIVGIGVLFLNSRKIEDWWLSIDTLPLQGKAGGTPILWQVYQTIDGNIDPVWPLFFVFPAFAFFLVWQTKVKTYESQRAIALFLLQLSLTAGWVYMYAGVQSLFFTLLSLAAVIIASILTIRDFYPISKTAALLMLPNLLLILVSAPLFIVLLIKNPHLF